MRFMRIAISEFFARVDAPRACVAMINLVSEATV